MRFSYRLLIFIILIKISLSWWDTGHMLVAQVAELDLKNKNPQAFMLAQNITSLLNQFSHGKINSFVESATWADDVKEYKLSLLDVWHYINVPVRLDDPDPIPHINKNDYDCIALVKTAMKVLTNWTKSEINDLYKNVFEKSMMLRYLIHVVGDIHQPLHSVEFFDEVNFPKGDLGGNLFLIEYSKNISNLHKFFDSGADSIPDDIKRPLNENDTQLLSTLAESFMNEFPSDNLSTDVNIWITESFSIAKNFIYKNVSYKGQIGIDYKNKSFMIIKERIAQAGFRLSKLIEMIYESYVIAKNDFAKSHFLR